MAGQLPTNPETELPDSAPVPAGGRSSILTKLGLVAFVAAVIGVECLLAYLYIPGPSQTAAMAGVVSDGDAPPDPILAADGQPDVVTEDQVEVDLGQFNVVSFQPASNTTLRIDFHMYGTIDSDDKAKFEAAMQDNQHRFRDQVIVTVRSCELSELTDAGLGLIKRRILEKSNRTFGKPFLQAVIFSEFSFIEQ
jgi:hypothetical protein